MPRTGGLLHEDVRIPDAQASRSSDLAIGLLVARADAGVEDYFGRDGVAFQLASGSGTR
jgi:hypothetical protein